MQPFLANLFLAFVWATMTGSFTMASLAFGFIMGYVILYFQQHVLGRSTYFGKARTLISFLLFFIREVIISSLRVAWEILHPRDRTRPGIIALELPGYSEFEAYVLATIVTLTPGSLSMDIKESEGMKILYIHAMFVDDPAALKEDLRSGLCRRLLEVMR